MFLGVQAFFINALGKISELFRSIFIEIPLILIVHESNSFIFLSDASKLRT
jgi:hypothetical protein